MKYRLIITYAGEYYPLYDEKLRKLIGRSHASGMGSGIRDHAYYGLEKTKLNNMISKLKKSKLDIGYDVEEDQYED